MPVIIAAHPRSQYEKMPGLFNGREVIKGKTLELIAASESVLTHSSTAINFAILFKKPITFLTSDRIEQEPLYGSFIRHYASLFNKETINMEQFLKDVVPIDLRVDEKLYNLYQNNYIKIDNSANAYCWNIVGSCIQNL